MSAIEASLRLEIAQYQQSLAKATASVVKFKEDARANSRDMGKAIMGPNEAWALSSSQKSALRTSLSSVGAEGGGLLGSGIMTGMGRVAGPTALAAGLILGLKKAGEIASANAVMQIRTEVLIGNKEGAGKLIADLKELGARTPLEFPDLAEAGNMLIAFGESAEAVPATLRRIGDVSTGVGARIGEIAEIYGKARVAGTLFAEDINQLTGRGIPVIQEFARILGVEESSIKKLGSEGKITFPLLEAAFINLTKEGGKFGGMMDKISKESSGKWSTVKDDIGAIAGEFGKPIDVVSKWGLDKVLYITGAIKTGLTKNFFLPEKAAAPKAAESSGVDKEAQIRADFEAQANVKNEEEARVASEKTAKEQASAKEKVLDLQRSMNREALEALPPAERAAAALKEQQRVFEEMRRTGGLFFEQSQAGLEALAKTRLDSKNFEGAETALRQLKEIRDLERTRSGADKDQKDAVKDSVKAKSTSVDEQLRLDLNRQAFDLETQIARAKAQSSGVENATVRAFQDQLNTLQLQAQVREQLNLSESESLKLAREKVAAERAAANAVKTSAQASASKDIGQDLAVLRAQAAGKEELAKQLQREIDIQREAKNIVDQTGVSEQKALQIAREKAQLKQQIEQRVSGASEGGGRYDSEGRRADGRKKIDAGIGGNAADRQDHLYGAGSRYRDNQANAGGLGPKAERNSQKEAAQSGATSQPQEAQQGLAIITQILSVLSGS